MTARHFHTLKGLDERISESYSWTICSQAGKSHAPFYLDRITLYCGCWICWFIGTMADINMIVAQPLRCPNIHE